MESVPVGGDREAAPRVESTRGTVTARSIVLGLVLACVVAWVNCWVATLYNAHFVGGVQMPFGAVFMLLFLILALNWPVRALYSRLPRLPKVLWPLSPAELLTVYAMLLFAALISTPGTDNFFITVGAGLFYFSTRENGWADLFYNAVPSWFAPGWNGRTYQKEVIDGLYVGGLTFDQIPWHAWSVMLIAWSVFLLLMYGLLFFTALGFRKQWLQREALAFPLVQLPLQMVEIDAHSTHPPARAFWGNRTMWLGFGLAFAIHFLKGMNAHYPEWPVFPVNAFGSVKIEFTEKPWSAMETITAELFLGAIGLAYLLTREMAFSFWFFFLFQKFEMVFAEMVGLPVVGMARDIQFNRPVFITFQSAGGFVMMAVILVWTAREYLLRMLRAAWRPQSTLSGERDSLFDDEPFSPRFVVVGFVTSLIGLLLWCGFAGINVVFALAFVGTYWMVSLVISRVVIEGGFLFPQVTFSTLEMMTTSLFSASLIGAANLTKLSFLQRTLMPDMRTNVLPAFMHTFKIADELRLDRRGLRRLLFGVALAIVAALATTIVASLWALYSKGGLTGYAWFTTGGPQSIWKSSQTMIKQQAGFDALKVLCMGVGAGVVWLLTFARARFTWFPLHPLGYIMASGYPITRLWFPFFVGWLVKTLVMKFGGGDTYVRVRPFMIGLIFGNLSAMVMWMLIGFYTGVQIPAWPA